jgi:hypothetical protein
MEYTLSFVFLEQMYLFFSYNIVQSLNSYYKKSLQSLVQKSEVLKFNKCVSRVKFFHILKCKIQMGANNKMP